MSCLVLQAARHYTCHPSTKSHPAIVAPPTLVACLGERQWYQPAWGSLPDRPCSTSPRAPLSRLSAASAPWQSGPSPPNATLDPANQPGDGGRDPTLAKHAGNTMSHLQRPVAADALCNAVSAIDAQPSAHSPVVALCCCESPPFPQACVLDGVQQDSRTARGPAVRRRTEDRRARPRGKSSLSVHSYNGAISLPLTFFERFQGSPTLHKEHKSYPGVPSFTVSNHILRRRRITASHAMCRCWSNPSPGHHQAQLRPLILLLPLQPRTRK